VIRLAPFPCARCRCFDGGQGILSIVHLSRIIVFICSLALAPSLASAGEHRSQSVKHEFQRLNPCPSTGRPTGACPGYVKDHVLPLACGGPDSVANLQWQTAAAAKAKDRRERKGCAC